MVNRTAAFWIDQLNLTAHPEGGYFREVYRSKEVIPAEGLPERYQGSRVVCTSIYFLLKSGETSALHRLKSDEHWHFYEGSPLSICQITAGGSLTTTLLGPEAHMGQAYWAMVPAGNWFGAAVTLPDSYTLVGCTVAPGFEFADFEMGDRSKLLEAYPEHSDIIHRFTPAP